MRRLPALSVFLQVTLLVAVSIAIAMAVAFGVILHAPPPAQPGFTIDEAVAALEGQTVRTAEGRSLRRSLSGTSPVAAAADQDPLARVISLALQQHLELDADAVRVRVPAVDGGERRRIHEDLGGRWIHQDGTETPLPEQRRTETIIVRRAEGSAPPPGAPELAPPPPGTQVQVLTEDIRGGPEDQTRQQITVFTEELRFPPFIASVRLDDGQWATVSPPTGLWSPWHTRILLTFLACLVLLLPLAWLMARRLARPVRLFAQAAERLGSDPHAPPLDETGPLEVRAAAHAFNDMQTKLNRYIEGRPRWSPPSPTTCAPL